MNEMLARVDELPPPLRDGQWTNCALSVRDGRIRFREPAAQSALRRALSLRRRAGLMGAGLLLLALLPWLPGGTPQVVAGVAASLLVLAALDGLGRDLRPDDSPFEYAVVDTVRQEVDLRAPGGLVLTAPLREIRMFLLVADAENRRFHLGVVFRDDQFLPWLSTTAGFPASSLTWLFGHLTGLPAMVVLSGLPVLPETLERAEPLGTPGPPEGGPLG